jgi:hypothetical protein
MCENNFKWKSRAVDKCQAWQGERLGQTVKGPVPATLPSCLEDDEIISVARRDTEVNKCVVCTHMCHVH